MTLIMTIMNDDDDDEETMGLVMSALPLTQLQVRRQRGARGVMRQGLERQNPFDNSQDLCTKVALTLGGRMKEQSGKGFALPGGHLAASGTPMVRGGSLNLLGFSVTSSLAAICRFRNRSLLKLSISSGFGS